MARYSINYERKIKSVWEWIFPTVVVAMSPLLAQYIGLILSSSGSYHIYDIFAHQGQIVLVGVALLGEAMTELVSRKIATWQKQALQAVCVAYILISSMLYAELSVSQRCVNVALDNITLINECAKTADKSMSIFFVGIVLCLICKLVGRS